MDIQHLRYFVAVARLGTVQAAADELFVCRQAVSKLISQMEAELGETLFVRGHTGLRLNEKGRRFIERAQALVESFESLKADMGKVAGACSIRICFPFTTNRYFNAMLEPYLESRKDTLRVETVNGLDEQCHRLLDSGSVDMGVSLIPFNRGGNDERLIASSPILIAMRENAPLARRRFISRDDLLNLPLVYYMNGYESLSWLSPDTPPPAYSVNDILMAFDLVLQGKAVFPIPELSILQPMPGMAFVPYRGPDDRDDFYCAINASALSDKTMRVECLALREALMSVPA